VGGSWSGCQCSIPIAMEQTWVGRNQCRGGRCRTLWRFGGLSVRRSDSSKNNALLFFGLAKKLGTFEPGMGFSAAKEAFANGIDRRAIGWIALWVLVALRLRTERSAGRATSFLFGSGGQLGLRRCRHLDCW